MDTRDDKLGRTADHRADTESDSQVDRLTRSLPHEIMPSTDLWPGIEARLETPVIEAKHPARRWWPQVAAALVLVSVSSLLTALWFNGLTTSGDAERVTYSVPAAAAAGLRSPEFMAVSELSPEDRDILIRNLDMVREARAEIEQRLKDDPNNMDLHDSWLQVYEQELDLLNVATWTTNGLAERVKT